MRPAWPQHNAPEEPAPLRVAQVVFSLEPGGMENGVVNLANHLPVEAACTRVFCLEKAGAFAARLRPDVGVCELGRRPGWDTRACAKLARELAHWRPDVIHTHNLGPLIYTVVARALQPGLWRVPILHGEHGALQGESLQPRRLRQRRLLYRLCRRVHTVSEGLRQELIARGFPKGNLTAVLNGVDCARFEPMADREQARRAVGLPSDAVVLGSVGRFIPTKRYPLLIEAFEILSADRPELRLLVLGDGGDAKQEVLRRIAVSPVRERIHAVGHQDHPVPYYQAMDLLVMPSSHEGLANALLEAMATGVPVLAHSACGAAEVVEPERTGFLRSIGTAEDLVDALNSALQNPDRLREMGRLARASAQARFSLESMVQGYLRLFRDCAGVRT